ncbi:MAG: hypothetical protein WC876_04480 [Candidatus Thermoplasmatota archaeon]
MSAPATNRDWKAIKADFWALASMEAKDTSVGALVASAWGSVFVGIAMTQLAPLSWDSLWAAPSLLGAYLAYRFVNRCQRELKRRRVREFSFEDPEVVAR